MADPCTILFPFYEYTIANILMKTKTMGKTAESTDEKTHTPQNRINWAISREHLHMYI